MFRFKRLSIRPLEESDLENLLSLRFQVQKSLGTFVTKNLPQQKRWFRRLSLIPQSAYYVLALDSEPFIGIVRTDEIDFVNRSIRVGGDLLPRFQDQGLGQEMIGLIKAFCFEVLNMHRIWLLVLESNHKAWYVYKKAGFLVEGCQRRAIFRDGVYQDYIMMSLLREEYENQRGT